MTPVIVAEKCYLGLNDKESGAGRTPAFRKVNYTCAFHRRIAMIGPEAMACVGELGQPSRRMNSLYDGLPSPATV